ncbi:MAG: ABC transporter substrate-binding protein [Veillonella sp.]|jgi:ABC transporter, substrate-binding protein|uniref:ABC transporter substrate-binding protein n=1 Tax=Veillonella TaxID=29465 RepID=UPI001CAB0E53|nr:ABC transporter substrate-binding protein [Veillonella sp.]MBF1757994.1 ABC transporter substrate-binding protein [Veillonella sp.]MDU2711922.1 ABC transporter substrate-binding protein [Veillonella sp.]MDU4711798.1 ABC transporter substrate-binding protein [Veillonella sp.]
MQLKRLLILLAIFCGVLVVAIMGMYKSWNAFTSGGIFGMLSSKGIYKMVDGTSETVILDHKAERIVAVGPNAADLASELAGDSVVASTAAPYQSSNGVKQRVALDVKAIAALKPDIVIVEDDDGTTDLVRPLREAGIKVALLRAPKTVKEVEDQTRNVGQLLGRADKAESLITTMMNYIRDTESLRFARRDDPKKTVAVYNENGLYGAPDTMIQDMLKYVNVDNAATKAGVKWSYMGKKDDLIKVDPDVIIVPADVKAPGFNRDAVLNSYYNDPALKNVKAIKNKKVVIISNEAMMAKTYHIGRGIYNMAQFVYER